MTEELLEATRQIFKANGLSTEGVTVYFPNVGEIELDSGYCIPEADREQLIKKLMRDIIDLKEKCDYLQGELRWLISHTNI